MMAGLPGSGAVRAGRLAAEVTSLVARDREVSAVRQLLAASRLVTLTGVGGIGKTRLAIRVVSQVRRSLVDGVWQVDLAGLRDGGVLEYAVAEMWGIQTRAGQPISQVLVDYVADRELLLLLDNCEHLLGACAALATSLLGAGPGVRVLCTSRQPLGVLGETVWEVPPLPIPVVNGSPVTLDDLAPGALTLFVARAEAASGGFNLTPDNALRGSSSDADGNTVKQTILRAYRLK
jgi:predicted ATPase